MSITNVKWPLSPAYNEIRDEALDTLMKDRLYQLTEKLGYPVLFVYPENYPKMKILEDKWHNYVKTSPVCVW
jgi:hypothetical protein